MRFALLCLAALLVAATPAQAIVIAAIQAPTAPVQPEVETAVLRTEVTVSCADLFPFGGIVDYTFQVPPSVIITGSTTQDVPACSSPQGFMDVEGKFQVAVTRAAPGLEQIRGELKVHFTGSPFSLQPLGDQVRSAEAPFALAADAFFLTDATTPRKMVACDCPEAVFDIAVSNLGNVRTRFDFEVVEAPAIEGWSASAPSSVILESPNTGLGPTNTTVPFVVRMPSLGEGAYQLRIRPVSADAPDKQGDAITVNVLAVRTDADGLDTASERASGSVAELPAVGAPLAVGLLAFAGLVRRRL